APPRRRVDQQRLSDRIAHDPGDHLDRVIGRAELEQPWSRPTRTGEFQVVACQPDDEDFGLNRTLDVEATRVSRHAAMVRRGSGWEVERTAVRYSRAWPGHPNPFRTSSTTAQACSR